MAATTLTSLGSTVNLHVIRTADTGITFTLTEWDSVTETFVPVDLTGQTVSMTVRDKLAGGSVLFSQSNGPTQHVDADAGETLFTIGHAAFPTITAELAVFPYEIRRIAANTMEVVHVTGTITLKATASPAPAP